MAAISSAVINFSFSILGRIEGGERRRLLTVRNKLRAFSILGRIEGGERARTWWWMKSAAATFQYPRPDRRG